MTARRWTSEDIDTIREMAAKDTPPAEIAAAFRINLSYLRVVAWRNGIRLPRSANAPKPRAPRGKQSTDLAARAAQLQGLTSEDAPAQGILEDEAIQAFVEDPETFFAWLGVSLFPYQQDALRLIRANDRITLVWPRQHGKDLLTALLGLWTAIVRPSSIVVCVSPSQRQSDLWMDRLKAFAMGKREISDHLTDLSQSEIAFSNGSRVYSLPSGAQGSATIRGFSKVSLLLANEAAWVNDDVFQAIQPFLAVSGKGAKLILASTPFGQSGYLWRAYNSDLFAKSHVTTILNPLIPPDFIEKERQSMDALSFASEYQAQFISSQSAYYPTELIQRCVESYPLIESPLPEHQGMTFYLGCDWARIAGADKTVLTIVGIDAEGHGKVIWIKSFDGVDYVTQGQYVEWLHRQWDFRAVYADQSNHALVDMLIAKGLPVVGVNFTVPSKVEMFGRLKAAMEASKLTIPNHPDLIRELSTFEYKISEHGNLLLHHQTGGHDDYPDSLALAAKSVTMESGKIGIVMVSDTTTVDGRGSYHVLDGDESEEAPSEETINDLHNHLLDIE